MALTSYFNWETPLQADLMNLFNEATPEEELLLLPPDYNPPLPPNYYNYSSSSTNFLYPPCNYSDLPYYDPIMIIPPHEDHYNHTNNNILYNNYNEDLLLLLPCPKRQKWYDQSLMMEGRSNIIDDGRKKESSSGGNVGPGVSAQSKAARERRRKIAERTRELGKLVPAAADLNTADMLQAAGKYLAYLKAQVAMLQLINTMQEEKALGGTEELKAMLTSPCVEEKLCLKEKCLVPKEFVTTLRNLQDVRSKPSILNDLNQLIQTESLEKKKKL